jgi:hypothetical protein
MDNINCAHKLEISKQPNMEMFKLTYQIDTSTSNQKNIVIHQ